MDQAAEPRAAICPKVPISWAELLDKIIILEIKSEEMRDRAALDNVLRELGELAAVRDTEPLLQNSVLQSLIDELRAINRKLWTIEDDIRRKEASNEFDDAFIELARSVYRSNDERARIKREINAQLGSRFVEEKQYCAYDRAPTSQ